MDRKDTIKTIKRAAREIHKGMKRGGPQGSPKGKRGFKRHPKHKGAEQCSHG